MSIPKIIHYCWFGTKPIPELETGCIESWKKQLPDYEFVLWNENNFDINSYAFTKQAYEKKMYAFVSDFVRVYALCKHGGIYLDTDVETLKDFAPFLENKAFIGFENKTMLGTGIIGAQKKHPVFEELLQYYKNQTFLSSGGVMNTIANVQILVDILLQYGFKKENVEQTVSEVHIYERDVFNPKKNEDGTFRTTNRTVTIHHFSGSWLTDRQKKRGESFIWRGVFRPALKKIRSFLLSLLGKKNTQKIELKIRNILK